MARIWILDENNLMLTVIARWLKRAGHTILVCASWEVAHARTARLKEGEDLLILDLTLGESSGMALMLRLRIPSLKFLFISQQSLLEWSVRDTALFHAIAPGRAHVIRKPFTGMELLTKIDDLIGTETEKAIPAPNSA